MMSTKIPKIGTISNFRRANGSKSVTGGRLEQWQETLMEGVNADIMALNMTTVEEVSV